MIVVDWALFVISAETSGHETMMLYLDIVFARQTFDDILSVLR